MTQPDGGCPTSHDWCARVCITGADPARRALPHVTSAAAPPNTPPTKLERSVGIETLGGVFTVLVPRCASLPLDHDETFSTAADRQSSVEVVIVDGEAPLARDNHLLGRFHLDGIAPAPRGVPKIRVRLNLDGDGQLSVTATDIAGGGSRSIAVRRD